MATDWTTPLPAHVAAGDPGHAQLHNATLDCVGELRTKTLTQAPVTTVNGYSGEVNLTAHDVGALADTGPVVLADTSEPTPPSEGVVLFSAAGALKVKLADGTVVQLAPVAEA